MTDAALARRTQRALTRSTSLWTRRLRATASASSRSALRARTAAWRRAPRALRTAGLRALLATTGTTCRAGRVSRSRCAVRASGSLRTAPRRRARARLALRTSIKTPWVIVRRRASRSLRAARVSACRQTLRRHAVHAARALRTSTRTPQVTARHRATGRRELLGKAGAGSGTDYERVTDDALERQSKGASALQAATATTTSSTDERDM